VRRVCAVDFRSEQCCGIVAANRGREPSSQGHDAGTSRTVNADR
jgi:hypothetical protein